MSTKTTKRIIVTGLLAALFYIGVQTNALENYIHLARQITGKETIVYADPVDFKRLISAPELNGGLGWFNVSKPLTLKSDLQGKIVLLDFWTYCCINCMHIIPNLKMLEKKYEKELVVIGVHSAKFSNEKESQNIRTAILRYEIEHPVVNDANFAIWNNFGINSWPSLVLIDPEGKIANRVSGEGQTEVLDQAIQYLIRQFQGKMNLEPIPLSLEKNKEPEPVLQFPGKIIADEKTSRVFISDSNHNRIVICNFTGKVLEVIGKGSIGKKDGSYEEAEFHHPQGMALDGEYLYIADTENHLLRRINLKDRKVETVAGTGEQNYVWKGGPGLSTGLNSPWDVVKVGKDIYIANAGQHQIWVYHPDNGSIEPYAGSGRENIQDGPVKNAQLAQPSGLATDGTCIYFADSEVSALRKIDVRKTSARVETLIGSGLFDFGDKEGAFPQTLLQHPLGVAYKEGKVYIADTYNHKIKTADIQARKTQTFLGNGKPGIGTSESPQFYEPSGLCWAGDLLFIADTNNNVIRVFNSKSNKTTMLNLDFQDYETGKEAEKFDIPAKAKRIPIEQGILAEGKMIVHFTFPKEYHLNPDAKAMMQYRLISADGKEFISKKITLNTSNNQIELAFSQQTVSNPDKIEIILWYYYCTSEKEGLCYMGSISIEGKINSKSKNEEVTVNPFEGARK